MFFYTYLAIFIVLFSMEINPCQPIIKSSIDALLPFGFFVSILLNFSPTHSSSNGVLSPVYLLDVAVLFLFAEISWAGFHSFDLKIQKFKSLQYLSHNSGWAWMTSKHLNYNNQAIFCCKILFSFSPIFVPNEKSSHFTAASGSSWIQASQQTLMRWDFLPFPWNTLGS